MDYIYANIDPDIIDSGEVKFTSVSAEVDNNSGTPSVDVSLRDDTDLHFFFHNLKGDQGVPGANGINGADGQPGQPGPQGPQGPQGLTGKGLDADGTLPWIKISEKPEEFKPENHLHDFNEIVVDKSDPREATLVDVFTNLQNSIGDLYNEFITSKLKAGENININDYIISATTDAEVIESLNGLGSRVSNTDTKVSKNTSDISVISSTLTVLNDSINNLGLAITTINGNITNLQTGKVNKSLVTGSTNRYQVLSDNNYTDDEKTKLSGIQTNAQVNKIESIELNGASLSISDKKVDLGNLAASEDLLDYTLKNKFKDFATAETIGDFQDGNVFNLIEDGINSKVDFEEGKSLVSDTEIEKLSTVVSGAQPNIIESIILNGNSLTVTNKEVDLGNLVEQENNKSLVDDNEIEKLSTVVSGAQPNIIESISLNGATLPIINKSVDLGNLVEQEEGKGLSSADFTLEEKNHLGELYNNLYDNGSFIGELTTNVSDNYLSAEDKNLLTYSAVKEYVENYVNDVINPIIEEIRSIETEVEGIKGILSNL